MPLAGTASILGGLMTAAVGAPPVASGFFERIANVLGLWTLGGVVVRPGLMVVAGTAVTGRGAIEVIGDVDQLGRSLADAAVGPQPADEGTLKTYALLAKAYARHLSTVVLVDPGALTSPSPVSGGALTGVGKLDVPPFAPSLAAQMEITDPDAASGVELFGVQILTHLALNAQVVGIPLVAPFLPLTAPPGGGPVLGSGSIA